MFVVVGNIICIANMVRKLTEAKINVSEIRISVVSRCSYNNNKNAYMFQSSN